MEVFSVYEDYTHHMAFLRAALNRVHNFCNTAPTEDYPKEKLEELRAATLRAYKAQVDKSYRTAKLFNKVVAKGKLEKNEELLKKGCSMLLSETRNVQRLSQILEVVIVGGRKGPDDFEEPLTDKDGNVLYKTDGEGNYITELNEETGEMEKVMRFSPPVKLEDLSHDISGFLKYVSGYADILEGKKPA